jgi:hypothetical protein
VKQRLAADLVRQDPDRAIAMLADLQQETREALQNLRELARGIYPPLLKIFNAGGYGAGDGCRRVLCRGHEISRWWWADRG